MADSLNREKRALAFAVRQVRASRGLRQEEVTDAAGLGRNFLTTLEQGRGNPTFEALVRIARALGISFAELARVYEERLKD